MIVNHYDFNTTWKGDIYGVGGQIMATHAYDKKEVDFIKGLLDLRRKHFGDGVAMMDCGANIGVHTVDCADHMRGWGAVLAVEAQERLFYALAGNITLHNCFNAKAVWGAICKTPDAYIEAPEPNYMQQGSFGSFELCERVGRERIGQDIDYSKPTVLIPTFTIDSLIGKRCDLLKIDIEGMEVEALEGAANTLANCRPIVVAETVKSDKEQMTRILEDAGYLMFPFGMNVLAVHKSDQTREDIKVTHHKAAA